MVVESVKKIRHIASEVFKGYANNTTGGCCGVSLPEEQQQEIPQSRPFRDREECLQAQ
jgi:hypothetical protein